MQALTAAMSSSCGLGAALAPSNSCGSSAATVKLRGTVSPPSVKEFDGRFRARLALPLGRHAKAGAAAGGILADRRGKGVELGEIHAAGRRAGRRCKHIQAPSGDRRFGALARKGRERSAERGRAGAERQRDHEHGPKAALLAIGRRHSSSPSWPCKTARGGHLARSFVRPMPRDREKRFNCCSATETVLSCPLHLL